MASGVKHYAQGTIAVANGDTSGPNGGSIVTGTATGWVGNALAGSPFIGPDFGIYAIAADATENTELEILPPYRGATVSSGGAYYFFRITDRLSAAALQSARTKELLDSLAYFLLGTTEPDPLLGGVNTVYIKFDAITKAIINVRVKGAGGWGPPLSPALSPELDALGVTILGYKNDAAASATAAASSATAAATSATTAAGSITTASGHAAAAGTSAAASETSATNAATSASGASTSAAAAAASAATANARATAAATSATAAAASATSAAASASSATTAKTDAEASAASASSALSNATTQATNAASSATAAASSATAAASSATAAASSAAAAALVARYSTTSTTNVTPEVGSKTFTVAAGLQFIGGERVKAVSAGSLDRYMIGVVTSYAGTTLTIVVDGVGTVTTAAADWNINLAGDRGPAGLDGLGAGTVTSVNGVTPVSGGGVTVAAEDVPVSGTFSNFTAVSGNVKGALDGVDSAIGAAGAPSLPQGRLTLTSGQPVLTANVVAATTVYYTPYAGQRCPIYNGTSFVMADIGGELSQATTDATKSPAAAAANKNYDVFVWLDGTTYRATRGPAWSSDTSRGTGVNTSDLERVKGVLVNKQAITNGPAAQRGTYVGTIRTNTGAATVDFKFGGSAPGGDECRFHVWNAYNSVEYATTVQNSTASWTYASATPRQSNGASAMKASFISGLLRDKFSALYQCLGYATGGADACLVGVMYDVTNAFAGPVGYCARGSVSTASGAYSVQALGFHYMAAGEACNQVPSGTSTWYGSASGAIFANGLIFSGWF